MSPGGSMIKISYPLNKLLTAIARQHQMKESLTEQELAPSRFLISGQQTIVVNVVR